MNILLAEDDADLRSILSQYLEINGFSILQAENGKAGLETFRSEHVDFCILDIMMPVMDGWELARQIRKMDPDMPIVFLTARNQKEDRIKGLKLGAEFLKYLFENKNQVLKREQILEDLWGENDYFLGRSMDVFVTRLRKYLRPEPDVSLDTIRGVGLILRMN